MKTDNSQNRLYQICIFLIKSMTCRAQVSMERQIILLDELEKTIKTQTYMQTQTHTYTYILNLQKHFC